MKDLMLDLETLGTAAGCVVLSIGAVRFDPGAGELGKEFHVVLSRSGSTAAGLFEDANTLQWWSKRSKEAQLTLTTATESGVPLGEGLNMFRAFVKEVPGTRVWGNGADFDNPILNAVYRAVGEAQPWAPYNGRCYRTLKGLLPGLKLERMGTHHNALDDAKTQALHAIQLFKALGLQPS